MSLPHRMRHVLAHIVTPNLFGEVAMTQPECNEAVSHKMESLRAGDVITTLSQLFGAPTDVIVVLMRFEDGTMVLSERAKKPSGKPDVNGPFYWSRKDMAMLTKSALTQHQHIGPRSEVKKGAGLIELGQFLEANPLAVETRTRAHQAYWATKPHS